MENRLAVQSILEFWRVLPKDRRFERPSIQFQGEGRFDDPARFVPVLYGAGSLETAIYETIDAYGLKPHPDAGTILGNVPSPTSADEADDAVMDLQIASTARRIPPAFYGRQAIFIRLGNRHLRACELRNVNNRRIISETPSVAAILLERDARELDVSVITSEDRELTQAIAGVLIRGPLAAYVDGIVSHSRRHGEIYAFFCDGRFDFTFEILTKTVPFTPDVPIVQSVAQSLGLHP